MSRQHPEWTDRFSDYLAEELDESARAAVEGHVSECGRCRLVLEELREVVSRARGLEELGLPRDLWPGIAAAIRMPVRALTESAGAQVIALPVAGARRESTGPAHITFTPPQLAAAAIVLIAISAMTTWWAGPGLGVRGGVALETPTTAAVAMVADVPAPPEGLADDLSALEEIFEAARATLDPNTVRVLQRNLSVIEQAITDSQQALALDPENEFLSQHLDRVYARKLAYLRDAARVIDWAG
jgi:hypothetical protein